MRTGLEPPRHYLGIDPGKSGGIAVVNDDLLAWAWKMPETPKDTCKLIEKIIMTHGPSFACCERVHAGVWHARAKKGEQKGQNGKEEERPRMGSKAAFTFGYGLGTLHGFLTALELAFEEVLPRKWQTELGCLTGGDKNVSKRKAQQLFPTIPKITHATADALLIAEYCRRKYQRWPSDPVARRVAKERSAERRRKAMERLAKE